MHLIKTVTLFQLFVTLFHKYIFLPYLEMEFADGGNLAELLSKRTER